MSQGKFERNRTAAVVSKETFLEKMLHEEYLFAIDL